MSYEELEVHELAELIKREKELAADLAKKVNPKDLPHVLLRLHLSDRRRLISVLPDELLKALLIESPTELLVELVNVLGAEDFIKLLSELPLDEVSDVLSRLPSKERGLVIERLPEDRLNKLKPLLAHSLGTAGALMTTQIPIFRADEEVERVIEVFISRVRSKVYYSDHYVYAVDGEGRLVGFLSASELMAAPRGKKLGEVVRPPIKVVRPKADREEVALTMVKYDLMELPVVDDEGRLLGVVTFDDAADVLLSRHAKDLERFGGFTREVKAPYLAAKVGSLIEKRSLCLIALCLLEAITVNVLSFFESVISAVVALSFFIPLLCDIGGNSGSQTASFVIRSLATGDVSIHDALRIATKEAIVSLGLGLTLSPVLFALGYAITWNARIALLLSIVVVAIVFVASMVGGLLPLISVRLGLDPAASSAPLITTIADIVGLTLYFTMASLWVLPAGLA